MSNESEMFEVGEQNRRTVIVRRHDRHLDPRATASAARQCGSILLRTLGAAGGNVRLEQLGMADNTLETFLGVIGGEDGIVLAVGPEVSGTTTTLCAATERICTERERIAGVGDRAVYESSVPEIRDLETASIALGAALGGQLVISTLRAADAASALQRLLELGVASHTVAVTTRAILTQRLVRIVCRDCRVEVPLRRPPRAADAMHPPTEWRGTGCQRCSGTGYRGRTGIYALLVVDDPLQRELLRHRGAADLRHAARAGGMRALYEDGLRHVRAGVTTAQEVARMTSA